MIGFEIEQLDLNAEHRLAALLSINKMTKWQKEQSVKLAKDIDIERFQKEVIEHRVYGLVMKNIQELNLFSEKKCVELNKKANEQIFDSMRLSRELIKINQNFLEKEIHLLLMKGPLLGKQLYGDVTTRTSRDLDILVSLKDINKAIEVLNELGYQTRYSDKYTPRQMEYIYRQGHHFDFRNPEGREIELHWKISEILDITLEDLWERRREVEFAGNKIAILGEEELMFLIHHGIGHGFHRMKWLVDIVEIIKQERVSWIEAMDYACATHRLNEFLTGIILCYVIDEFDMPDISTDWFGVHKEKKNVIINVYQENNDYLVKSMKSAKKLVNAMKPVICYDCGNRDYIVDSKAYIECYHTYIREMDYFQGKSKIRRMWDKFQPGEREFNLVHLNDKCFFMYYILRPFYWIYLVIKAKKN